MSMFVYKGERGVKNALNSVYMVCTQSQSFKKYQENVWIKLLLAYKYSLIGARLKLRRVFAV